MLESEPDCFNCDLFDSDDNSKDEQAAPSPCNHDEVNENESHAKSPPTMHDNDALATSEELMEEQARACETQNKTAHQE